VDQLEHRGNLETLRASFKFRDAPGNTKSNREVEASCVLLDVRRLLGYVRESRSVVKPRRFSLILLNLLRNSCNQNFQNNP